MKNTSFIIILFLIYVKVSFGQNIIYSIAYTSPQPTSNFENRDADGYFYIDSSQNNNIWQIGQPSKTLFNTAFSPDLVLITDSMHYYPNNNVSSFELEVYTDDATEISFWHYFDTDSLQDGGTVEVSTDGGTTWVNIVDANIANYTTTNFYAPSDTITSLGKPGFSGQSNGWIHSTISGYALYNHRIRFTFASDNINNNKEGWMLDNFVFQCLGTSVKTLKDEQPINLFPSPAKDHFQLNLDADLELLDLTVFDANGQLIYKGQNKQVDCSSWALGWYLVEITTTKGRFTKELLKQ